MTVPDNTTQTPLLADHDFRRGVGHAEELTIDATAGVRGRGFMSVPSSDRDRIVAAADNGKEWQLSVGGTAPKDSIRLIAAGQTVRVNNRGLQGPLVVVSNYKLREISILSTGADETGAVAKLVAAFDQDSLKAEPMNFKQWLAALGVDIDTLTATQLSTYRSQFLAETQNTATGESGDTASDESGETETVAETNTVTATSESGESSEGSAGEAGDVVESTVQRTREATANEIERSESLTRLNARFGSPQINVDGNEVSLLAHATRNGWSAEQFELHALRRQMPQRMNPRRNNADESEETLLAAMTFAILGHANVPLDRDFRPCESAHLLLNASLLADPNSAARDQAMNRSRDYRHASLFDMMNAAMRIDGIECGSPVKSDQWFQAAFSSNSVQTLFTTSTQAILLESFMQHSAAYANFAAICRERDVPNFKANERKAVSPDTGDLKKLNPTETAGDATLTATGESYSIARFAKRWGIDDQDMINEEFGVFEDMPMFLGMSAARLFGYAVAKLLLNNPNMADGNAWVNSTFGNLRTSSALNNANMKAALNAFAIQTDGAVTLDLRPDTLFLPVNLGFTAREVLDAAPLITGNTTTQTSRNVLAGQIQNIHESALLDNGFVDPDDGQTTIAGENDGWWLFDTRYPAIEVGHLAGSGRGPTIRTGNYDDGRYGIWFDVKRDLGAAPMRRASVQKNEA